MAKPPPIALRIKALRERAGLSMADLARALGFRGASSYQRYEDPVLFTKPYVPLDIAEKLTAALAGRGVPPISRVEVMALAGQGNAAAARMIPVVGYVGAGAEVFAIDDHAKGGGIDEVECPWSGLAQSTVAVRVRGDSMAPAYFDGDLIFYERSCADFLHLLGKECVVALTDGRRFVKQLRRTQSGAWYLHSHNAEPILGVEIEWAGKVKLIQRAE
jgi:phage repressor protein C with HTH and peptisase S24 domain